MQKGSTIAEDAVDECTTNKITAILSMAIQLVLVGCLALALPA
jgi:hypothetical protein